MYDLHGELPKRLNDVLVGLLDGNLVLCVGDVLFFYRNSYLVGLGLSLGPAGGEVKTQTLNFVQMTFNVHVTRCHLDIFIKFKS